MNQESSTPENTITETVLTTDSPVQIESQQPAVETSTVIDNVSVEVSEETTKTITSMIEEEVATTPYPTLPEQFVNSNTTQDFEHTKEKTVGVTIDPIAEHIRHASLPVKDVIELFERMPEASEQDTDLARQYFETVELGLLAIPQAERFQKTLERVDADYRQYLQTEAKGKLGYSVPKFADKDAAKVSGDRAILRFRALMGKGSILTIPLWHSGFWITIRTPSEAALLELRRRLMDDKIRLGRDTQGLIFSNTQAYTSGWLLDLCMEHFYDCTLKDQTDVRSKIQTPDLPVLFWGLACAIWPAGYQYSRAILTEDAVKTKEIITAKIDVAKLMWVDNSAFSAKQKAHMSNRAPSTMDEASVKNYLEDFSLYAGRKVEINENISLTLNVPTVEEYIKTGQRWVSDVVAMVDRTFTSDATHTDSRRLAIQENAQATIIRQFGHWIKSIVAEEIEHTERDTIEAALEMFSEDKEVRNKIINEVNKYIDDVTVAVIAIPETTGKETGLPRFPRLIPIDVSAVFFTLLTQQINRILNS